MNHTTEVYLCTLVYTQICGWMKPNHPEHSSKELVLRWPSQSPGLSLTGVHSGVQRAMHKRVLQTSINWRNTINKSESRILHNYVRDWWRCTENHYFQLFLLKMVLEVKLKLGKQKYPSWWTAIHTSKNVHLLTGTLLAPDVPNYFHRKILNLLIVWIEFRQGFIVVIYIIHLYVYHPTCHI